MLVIRFFRTGKKNQPFFRIVVTDKKNPPRGGRFLEVLGFFNPFTKEKNLKAERIKYWLSVGAQPSDRVHNLLVGDGIIKGKKVAVNAKPKKKEEAPVVEAPGAEKETPTPAKAAAGKPAIKKAVPTEGAEGKEEKPAKPPEKPAEQKPKEKKEEMPKKPAEPAEKEKPETEKK